MGLILRQAARTFGPSVRPRLAILARLHCFTRPWIAVVTVLASLPSQVSARPDDYKTNVREACRQAVAGAYLKAYDERERTHAYAKALSVQLDELATGLKAAKTRLAQAKTAAAAHDFDVDRAAAVDYATAAARSIEDQKAESEGLHRAAVGKLSELKQREKAMRAAIERLFVVKRVEDRPDGGYPFEIEYRSACPKYRHLCTLPIVEAERLERLELDGVVPVPCKRYAGLSRLR